MMAVNKYSGRRQVRDARSVLVDLSDRLVGTFRQGVGILAQKIKRGCFFGRKLGRGKHLLLWRHRRNLGEQFNVAVTLKSGTSRNQAAHDDVLLEPTKEVHLAGDSRLCENARGLLEARRRD